MFYRFAVAPPRSPLMRLIGAVVGALMLLALIALGMFAFLALVIGGAVFMLVRALRKPRVPASPASPAAAGPARMDVIDGEFTVIEHRETSTSPR